MQSQKLFFFFQAEDGIRDYKVTGVQTCALPICIDGDLSPARTQFGNNILDHWFWSEELRLNMDFSKVAHATVGGYYSDEKTTYYTLQDIRYVGGPVPPFLCVVPETQGICPFFPLQFIGNDPVQTTSKATFVTLTWKDRKSTR